MAIRHGNESAYVQERRKWETQPVMIDSQEIGPQMIDGRLRPGFTDGTFIQPLARADGGRYPYVHQEYPKALFKAKRADGGPMIDLQTGSITARDEAHERLLKGQGWHEGQQNAIDAIYMEDLEHAQLAANRAAQDRTMSDRARAEAAKVDEGTMYHVPAIPETPIKPRGVK